MISPALKNLVIAMCERSAEPWAQGNEAHADLWAHAAWKAANEAGFAQDDDVDALDDYPGTAP